MFTRRTPIPVRASSTTVAAVTESRRQLDPDATLAAVDQEIKEEAFLLLLAKQESKQEPAALPSRVGVQRTPAFDALVSELERAGDGHGPKRLNGPGLAWCLQAFSEHPIGFSICVQRALERFRQGHARSALGLLCHLVRQGEHEHCGRELGADPATSDEQPEWLPYCVETCIDCDTRTELDRAMRCEHCHSARAGGAAA